MTTNKDGGPAFPRAASTDEHNEPCNIYQDQDGMTLRDWFAGQALAGVLAAEDFTAGTNDLNASAYVARNAYSYADAMIAERENVDD